MRNWNWFDWSEAVLVWSLVAFVVFVIVMTFGVR